MNPQTLPHSAAAPLGADPLAAAVAQAEVALAELPEHPRRRLALALALFTAERFAAARAQFAYLATQEPENAAAHDGLGRCAKAAGALDEALAHFHTAASLCPDVAKYQLALADTQLALGQAEAAATTFQALLGRVPDISAAHGGLGYARRQQNLHEQAAGHFAQAAALQPENSKWPLELAAEQRATRQFAAARATLQNLLHRTPYHLPAQLSLAETERAAGNRAAELAIRQRLADAYPFNAAFLIAAAHGLRESGQLDAARAMYQRGLAQSPADGWIFTGLGQIAKLQGAQAEADGYFARALELLPDDDGLRLDLAAEHLDLGRFDTAFALAEGVLARQPDNLRALACLAEVNRAAGRDAAALALLTTALERAPRHAKILIQAAHCLRGLSRLDEAQAMYQHHLQQEPGNGWAYVGLGQIAKKRALLEEAERCFARALALNPQDDGLHLNIAAERREMGQFGEARAMAQAVLNRLPRHRPALVNLAATEHAAGDYAAALTLLQTARDLAPENVEILVKMASAARLLGAQAQCDAYFAEALRIDPLAITAVCGLAEQYMRADDAAAAVELLHTAIAAKPEETTFQFALLDALIAAGQHQAALAQIEAMQAVLGPNHTLLAKTSHVQHAIGQYHEAVATARAAVGLYPFNFMVWNECFHCERLLASDDELAARLASAPAVTPHEQALLARARGGFAERCGELDAAALHYAEALRLVPQDAGIAFEAARIALLRLELDEARALLQRHSTLDAPNLRLRGKSLNASQTLYGQLLDEYALNEAPPRVAPLRGLPLAERLPALTEHARAEPDNTAAAVALVLALRESGQLARITHPGGAAIPKHIFQFWDSAEIPADIAAYRASWAAQNPDYKIHAFDNVKAVHFLSNAFPPPAVAAFREALEPAQKADIFRLAALYAYGGVYADADDRCQRPLTALLPADAALVLYQEDLGTIGNNFIAVAPRHPLLLQALQAAVQAVNRGDSDIAWLSTGPGMMTRAFAQAFAQGAAALPGATHVLPLRDFCQVVAIHCASGYKQTRKHWTNSSFTSKASRPAQAPAKADPAAPPPLSR